MTGIKKNEKSEKGISLPFLKTSFRIMGTKGAKECEASFYGVICVSEYARDYVELKTENGRVRMKGENFNLRFLDRGLLEINGCIREISF